MCDSFDSIVNHNIVLLARPSNLYINCHANPKRKQGLANYQTRWNSPLFLRPLKEASEHNFPKCLLTF